MSWETLSCLYPMKWYHQNETAGHSVTAGNLESIITRPPSFQFKKLWSADVFFLLSVFSLRFCFLWFIENRIDVKLDKISPGNCSRDGAAYGKSMKSCSIVLSTLEAGLLCHAAMPWVIYKLWKHMKYRNTIMLMTGRHGLRMSCDMVGNCLWQSMIYELKIIGSRIPEERIF